jgi:hypothetical protein
MNEKTKDSFERVFFNKLNEEEFNSVTSMIKPHLVEMATEFENVETPDERRLRLEDENDAAQIEFYEKEIVTLKAKRSRRAQDGFHIDPNRYYARPNELHPPPKPPPKIDFDPIELANAIASTICPDNEMSEILETLTHDELISLASEIKRQFSDEEKKREADSIAYNKIDWNKVAAEYDKQNPT